MATKANTQGYDVSNTTVYNKNSPLKPVELDTLTCPACEKVLKEPVQVIACGHRFCKGCISALTSGSEGPFNCLVDGESFEATEIRNDRGCHKEICGLEVDCPTRPTPCDWRGKLVKIELHVKECPNVEEVCNLGCGARFPRALREQHASECAKRLTSCSYCGFSIPMDALEGTEVGQACIEHDDGRGWQDHYLSCEGYPTSCDYCGKDLSSRRELTKHWEDECTECEMTCPLNKLGGCNFKAKRLEMLQHAQDCHTIQAFEKIVELQEQITEVKSQNQQLQVDLKDKNEFIEKLSDRLTCVERFIRSGVEIPDFVEADCAKSLPRSEPDFVEPDRAQQYPKSRVDTQLMQPTDIVEADCSKTTTISARAQKQTPQSQFHISLLDTEPSSEVKLPLNLLREEMDTQKSQLMQLSENMQTVQESVTRHAIAIDEVRLRQDVIDVKTTNGVFIWKIPDVRRRYRDAVGRKTISLYSPPFYTSPHGYRMCIRAYLNGDGIGKGSHVSVFLVLMRSEHDSLLSWPFKQSVRFTLINQVNSSASISEAFIPDLQSPSFQRPEAEMNVASGFPKFARQSVLQDETFTKGNIIFIKAKVDLTGLTMQ